MTWPTVPLGELCSLVNGRAFRESDWSTVGSPIIRIQNLNNRGNGFNHWSGELHGQVLIKPGDLLLAWSGTPGTSFGAHIWTGPSGVLNQHIFRVDLKLDKIDPRWAVLAINDQLTHLIDLAHGGVGLKHVTRGTVQSLMIPLPSLEEQRRIAAILDKADALRQKRRTALQKLDSLSQSIFFEMFGDSLRDESKCIRSLAEVCARITDGTHQPPKWAGSGIPFLFVSNIRAGRIDFNTEKWISEVTYRELTRLCPIEVGDVLYTTVGSYGNSAVVPANKKFAFQRHIAHIKPNRSLVRSEFLAIMLESTYVRRQADKLARGIAQKTLNLAEIRSFKITVPKIEKQDEFVTKIAQIETLKLKAAQQITKEYALFASLQFLAFRGEL